MPELLILSALLCVLTIGGVFMMIVGCIFIRKSFPMMEDDFEDLKH